jgi:Glycosyltransferase family 87
MRRAWGPGVDAAWQSLVTIRRRWVVAAFVVSAIFAGGVALFSTDSVHRLWGAMAACAYVLAAVAVMAWKSRGTDLALIFAFCGALLVPLAWMAWSGQEQPEVSVVAHSAAGLLHHGSPYEDTAALASTHDPNSYNPYLPMMALFGMPRALFGGGPVTDPRLWFGVVFLLVFWLALRAGGARDVTRWTVLVAASPVIAFELAVGGTDVPMVAFLCLGFALLWQARPELAGVALGIAATMKATAWPALLVAFTLLIVRDGKRAAARFTAVAVAVVVVCVGPFLIHDPGALTRNTILFPLGLAKVASQASSPLPGHVLADTGRLGHAVVVAVLLVAYLAVAASLVVRPPRTVPQAMMRLVIGLTIGFVLAPSTRFGYFIYPATLVVWMLVVMAGRAEPDPGNPPVLREPGRRATAEPQSAALRGRRSARRMLPRMPR